MFDNPFESLQNLQNLRPAGRLAPPGIDPRMQEQELSRAAGGGALGPIASVENMQSLRPAEPPNGATTNGGLLHELSQTAGGSAPATPQPATAPGITVDRPLEIRDGTVMRPGSTAPPIPGAAALPPGHLAPMMHASAPRTPAPPTPPMPSNHFGRFPGMPGGGQGTQVSVTHPLTVQNGRILPPSRRIGPGGMMQGAAPAAPPSPSPGGLTPQRPPSQYTVRQPLSLELRNGRYGRPSFGRPPGSQFGR